MLTKSVAKLVQNLEKKKFREEFNLFKIEGGKLVKELLTSDIKIRNLYGYAEWQDNNIELIGVHDFTVVSGQEMRGISNFNSLPEVIALAEIPSYEIDREEVVNSLSLILNGIQDPGNFGTIMRLADWFGVRNIFCDTDCASFHNPKCVQASMGAIFRVKVFYTDLPELLSTTAGDFHCYGTFLHGDNIYETTLSPKGFIIMGNEGKGISPDIEKFVDKRLTIPSFAHDRGAINRPPTTMESLNVGVATGIVLSEFRRATLQD
ncbi:RNA methyltransferase [Bacteroidia bacterium]|nr:RNA methyltransferase [Bacteroidia bacterium]